MSVLSNRQIRKAHKNGHIIIDPFVSSNIRKSSVDVRLGHWFWRCDETTGIYNPRDQEAINRYFDVAAGPKLAKPYESVYQKIGAAAGWKRPVMGGQTFAGIDNRWPVIVLRPHETILAHTIEFIGINPPGTSEMRARSTWGRNGLGVCKCAGAGDPGYWSRWTYELTNFNSVPLIIPIGERIAQMIFHKTGQVDEGQYGAETGSYKSNYQSSADVREVMKNWNPYDMLPRPATDKLLLPEDYNEAFTASRDKTGARDAV